MRYPVLSWTALGAPLLLVTACGGGGGGSEAMNRQDQMGVCVATFDPATRNLPLPNILSTTQVADPLASRRAGNPMGAKESLAYIHTHEVAGSHAVSGVNAPIYLRFSRPLQAATVNGDNIKVF